MIDGKIEYQIDEAISEGDVEQVANLIGADKDRLNAMTLFGTWLHIAASRGKLEVVKLFVEMGIDVNTLGGLGDSGALERAASEGHADIVQYLLSRGAKLDVSKPERNPLFGAILGGYTEVAKALIDAGIDTKVKYMGTSGKEKDALSFARVYARKEIIAMLSAGRGEAAPVRSSVSPHDEIISHMARHFGPVEELGLTEIVPATGVRINVIPARSSGDPLILFTTGMSDIPQKVPAGKEFFQYTELFIRLPANWPLDKNLAKPENFWPIKWLKQVASYPHDNNTWLGGPFTIFSNGKPPKPIATNTKLTCMMILREQANVNPIHCEDGRQILLYSLVPLYTEERDLEKAQGIAALFERFEARGISLVVEPKRANSCK